MSPLSLEFPLQPKLHLEQRLWVSHCANLLSNTLLSQLPTYDEALASSETQLSVLTQRKHPQKATPQECLSHLHYS